VRHTTIDGKNDKEPIVDLNDVWVAYDDKWILKSIYLQCYPGEIFGIVGPNGGGKTTLLNVILGLVTPKKGSVQLFTQQTKQAGGRISSPDFPCRPILSGYRPRCGNHGPI